MSNANGKVDPFNVIVIGAGSGGLVTAVGAAGLGARVALIEKHKMGGDCLNYGCVPSKALLRSAKMVSYAKRGSEFGINTANIEVDFPRIMQRVKNIQAQIAPHDSQERMQSLAIQVYRGHAKFISANEVAVNGQNLWGKKIVIATGARALVLPIPGLEQAGYLTNETVFDLTKLPARLAVLGGGPIGVELAQAFQRFGSQVSIVELAPQILPREDSDAAKVLHTSLQQDGAKIFVGHKAVKVEKHGHEKIITLENPQASTSITVDEILVALGRRPNIEGMDLERAGVHYDKKGVQTNARLQTSAKNIYAVGDIVGPYQFTHTASYQAGMVIRNMLFPGSSNVNYNVIPWCTFTDPEIARVGLSETEAQQQNIQHEVIKIAVQTNDRHVCDSETQGFLKAIVTKKGKILGATIVSIHAGDLLHPWILAMKENMSISKFFSMIHIYPTLAEITQKASVAFRKMSLTPGRKKVLSRYLAWSRK